MESQWKAIPLVPVHFLLAMSLSRPFINSFAVAKVYPREGMINSLDFSFDGELLVAGADDASLVCYNAVSGK